MDSSRNDGLTRVEFTATISLLENDIEEADGDVKQAVQNVIGGMGAQVIDIDLDGD